MYIYPAFFYKDNDGYSVVFKDLELATSGATLQEALLMAEEALTGRVYLILQDGETLPKASDIENIQKPKEADFVTLIKTDKKYLTQDKAVRKDVENRTWTTVAGCIFM
jgi:phage protein